MKEEGGGEVTMEEETAAENVKPATMMVGYILNSKKVKSFLQPKFLALAREKGIEFVPIMQHKSLLVQGPFDVILHKSQKELTRSIEEYGRLHPEVIIIDPPRSIQHLHNRQSMLQIAAELNLTSTQGKIGIPKQVAVTKTSGAIPDAIANAELKLPLVVRPFVVDGTAKAHELALSRDLDALSRLEPPLVLQEFINHGGVLFKVYVVGNAVNTVRRSSLPNIDERSPLGSGVIPFPRVSSHAAVRVGEDLDPEVSELPPMALLEELAKELSNRLGLRLFNFDIIRELGTKDQYYVIDINYFPGYSKMPDYEQVLVNFLLSLRRSIDDTRSS